MPLSTAVLALAALLAQAPATADLEAAVAARAARGDVTGAIADAERLLAATPGARPRLLYLLARLEQREQDACPSRVTQQAEQLRQPGRLRRVDPRADHGHPAHIDLL